MNDINKDNHNQSYSNPNPPSILNSKSIYTSPFTLNFQSNNLIKEILTFAFPILSFIYFFNLTFNFALVPTVVK